MNKPDLERDLLACEHLVLKAQVNRVYAQHLYAALCNNEWIYQDILLVLKDQRWSCSWRAAGSIVADMRGQGDYMDWYCSGMVVWVEADIDDPNDPELEHVPEGMVTEEVARDLAQIGWCKVDQ